MDIEMAFRHTGHVDLEAVLLLAEPKPGKPPQRLPLAVHNDQFVAGGDRDAQLVGTRPEPLLADTNGNPCRKSQLAVQDAHGLREGW